MEDLSLRTEFRRALDVVAPPAPWLAANVRIELRRQRQEKLARQRRWFGLTLSPSATRLLAIALIVVLMVAASGAFLAIHHFVLQPNPIHTHPGAVSRTCSAGTVDMITTKVGWQGTSRTTDGGTTWRDVSPPTLPRSGKGGGYLCVLDANHAWVTEATSVYNGCQAKGCAGPEIDGLYVMATADGGVTWQTSEKIPENLSQSLTTEFDFIDALHGWLLTDTGFYTTHPNLREVYTTSDGGLHWNQVASGSPGGGSVLGTVAVSCNETGITFSSVTTGWLTWDCSSGNGPNPPAQGGPFVAVTRDGGRTWAAVNLPVAPAGCGATPPVFTAKSGVLLVSCGGANAFAYRTADSGQTWLVSQQQLVAPVDFVNGTTGFFFTFDQAKKLYTLYTTTSGGAGWSVVKSGLFSGRSLSDFQFIDDTTGFANLSNSPVAWVTSDGGKTWSLPPPYRSVGNEICAQPADPGAGNGPTAVKMFDRNTGWAAGARRTTDGGADWTNVSPASVKLRSSAYAESFLDPTHAWVAQGAGSSTACADRVVVFRTSDGGATWQHGPPVIPAAPSGWSVSLDFLDANNGWLVVGTLVYRSSNGGDSWTPVSDLGHVSTGCTLPGPLIFSSITTGWVQMQCNNSSPGIAVTHDGGASWTTQILARSSCCVSSALPTFFDPTHGMLFDFDGALLAMTSDGGLTWARHGLPRLTYYSCVGKGGVTRCSNQSIMAVSFTNPNVGWALESNDLRGQGGPFAISIKRTEDGGKTWTSAKANLTKINGYPNPSQNSLTFVDSNTGFLWLGSKLFMTTDGGHTWTPVPVNYR